MSLLTCANNLKGNDYAVAQWLLEHPNQNWNNNYLYADLDKWRVRLDLTNKDYYISVNDEHVVITKNANTPFEVVDINNASTLIK
jgi:hypothetical protein